MVLIRITIFIESKTIKYKTGLKIDFLNTQVIKNIESKTSKMKIEIPVSQDLQKLDSRGIKSPHL